MVFVANDDADAVAIRDGGQGDVTETHVLWKNDIGMPDICSPLVTDQYLLLIAAYGGLICYDRMEGGEPVWEEDFGAMFGSSPGLVGDRIYLIADDGQGWVVTAGPGVLPACGGEYPGRAVLAPARPFWPEESIFEGNSICFVSAHRRARGDISTVDDV